MTTRIHEVSAAARHRPAPPRARWQVGGALGVAVIGSLLITRYQDNITAALAPYHVPAAVMTAVRGSLGGALEVAARAGGALGAGLAHVAREAFVSGMDLGLVTGALVVLGGALVAFIVLPRHHH